MKWKCGNQSQPERGGQTHRGLARHPVRAAPCRHGSTPSTSSTSPSCSGSSAIPGCWCDGHHWLRPLRTLQSPTLALKPSLDAAGRLRRCRARTPSLIRHRWKGSTTEASSGGRIVADDRDQIVGRFAYDYPQSPIRAFLHLTAGECVVSQYRKDASSYQNMEASDR
jgi:hypothetical protein